MTKPTLWIAVCVVALAGMFSGCQSSKIAYGNSYYFKQSPKATANPSVTIDKVAPSSAELQVSSHPEQMTQRDASVLLEKAQAQLQEVAEKSDNVALKESTERFNKTVNSIKGQELTKKEARTKRKELRKELRTLTKEYRNLAPAETNDLDKNLKVGLILLGVGLVLLILGAFVPVIGLLGVLSMVAGLVFFVIWLATEA